MILRRRDSVIPRRGMPLMARTLPLFRREVVALLVVGHRLTANEAVREIGRWRNYVTARWREGKPPCAVADHIAKWRKEKIVCPCPSHGSRDPSCPRHGRRRRYRRDASNPQVGETFESKEGKRWVVRDVKDNKVVVDSAGIRQVGTLTWSRAAIERMKQLSDPGRRKRGKGRKKGDGRKKQPTKRCKRGVVIQSLIFDREIFSLAKARAWVRSHGHKGLKVDTTPTSYRFRQIDPKRVIVVGSSTLKKGLRVVYGCPKRGGK